MDKARIKALRNGASWALTLYLDIPEELEPVIIDWEEAGGLCTALDARASEDLLRFLLALPRGAIGRICDDEASRAIALMLGLGEDRQAFLVDLLEGFLSSRPSRVGDRDWLAGYAEQQAESKDNWAQTFTEAVDRGVKEELVARGLEDEEEEPTGALLEASAVLEALGFDGGAGASK